MRPFLLPLLLLTALACREPDGDGDGIPAGSDCDDADPSVHPGATEVCDGVDQDCDGVVDDDATDMAVFYADADGDGFGDADSTSEACEAPAGTVEDATDCDDGDAAIRPGADEHCDDVDEDCDGVVDEDAVDPTPWHADADGDGFGAAAVLVASCDQPADTVADGTDCDDEDDGVHPGADEDCGPVDRDCDGSPDAGATDAPTWHSDSDGDGYGDPDATIEVCVGPAGTVADGTDCDDKRADVNPGALEVCGGGDEDCDGAVDEADASDATSWFPDGDGDGHGTLAGAVVACEAPAGYAPAADDCDDADPGRHACGSCLEVLDAGLSTGDGVYALDPCGTGASDFWCDMTTDGGGWTVAGRQAADGTDLLGSSVIASPGDAAFSVDLACVAFDAVGVFNQDTGEWFTTATTGATWSSTSGDQALVADDGTEFRQGGYGPGGAELTMACVGYTWGFSSAYACDNDAVGGQQGHLTDYAGEFCAGGRLDGTWAWSDGKTCSLRGTAYTWGIAVR